MDDKQKDTLNKKSYESDGKMGNKAVSKNKNGKIKDFFNTTSSSE